MSAIDYPALVRQALLEVPRHALRRAASEGLPGDHHFYLSFLTDHPGVSLSTGLRARHPREMTIVLQHQYWDLAVGDDAFSVTLRFGGAPERLHVPFAALTAFVDPSAEFGLRFDGPEEAKAVRAGEGPGEEAAEGREPAAAAPTDGDDRPANVVDIREFRRGEDGESAG